MSHEDSTVDEPLDDSRRPDEVTLEWRSESDARTEIIIEPVAERQRKLESALRDAIAHEATHIGVTLLARQGIAGVILPAQLLAGVRKIGAQLEVAGKRI